MACKASDSCHSWIRTSPQVIWEPSFSLPGFLPAHWSHLSGAAQIRLLGLAVQAFCEPMPGLYSLTCGVWCQTQTGLWFRVKMTLSVMSLHPDLLHWHHYLYQSPVPTPHTLTWSHVHRMDMQNGRLCLQNANELVLRCGYGGS